MFAKGQNVPVGSQLSHTFNDVGTTAGTGYSAGRKEKVELISSSNMKNQGLEKMKATTGHNHISWYHCDQALRGAQKLRKNFVSLFASQALSASPQISSEQESDPFSIYLEGTSNLSICKIPLN